MWKQLLDALTQLMTLTQETRQNRIDINGLKQENKELRQEIQNLNAAVQRLAYEIQRSRENEAHERQNLALRLENELLKCPCRSRSKTRRRAWPSI